MQQISHILFILKIRRRMIGALDLSRLSKTLDQELGVESKAESANDLHVNSVEFLF